MKTSQCNWTSSLPCRITFPEAPESKKRKHDEDEPKEAKQELLVEPFVVPNRGPYPFNQPKKYVTCQSSRSEHHRSRNAGDVVPYTALWSVYSQSFMGGVGGVRLTMNEVIAAVVCAFGLLRHQRIKVTIKFR